MKVKKKKTLAQKIAEKEAAAEEARLEALAAEEEDTPEARSGHLLPSLQFKHLIFFLVVNIKCVF